MSRIIGISGIIIIIGLISCGKVSYRELEPVVDRDLVIFPEQSVPTELLMEAEQNSIIILGETHYVQEHQEWGSLLLKELLPEDYTVFMNELPHASGWLVNDYVNGERDQLPERIRYFDNEWLENIREINATRSPEDKIIFCYMDVNHTIDDFRYSLIEIEEILGDQPLFQRVLTDPYDSETYKTSLLTLQSRLKDRKEDLILEIGQKWYDRIVEMVDVEIPSREYRFNNDENLRENTIYKNIHRIIDMHNTEKYVINVGMFHAQKITLMGENIPRIAQLLENDFPDAVFSISFNGVRGISKYKFYENKTVSIDLVSNTAKRDLMHVIGERSENYMGYLLLDDPIYEQDMKVTYTKTDTKVLAPGKQFDAIITYPQISVLRSLEYFDY